MAFTAEVESKNGAKQMMGLVPYLIPHLLLSTLVVCVFVFGYRTYEYACIGLLLLAVLDSLIVANDARSRRLIQVSESGGGWRVLLYAMVPLYFAFLLGGFGVIGEARTVGEYALTVAVVGAVGAILVIPVAHELMHGRVIWDRATALLLMCAFSYPHFCIEHTSGHHRNVGTPVDSVTARHGEGFYTFYRRAVSWSLINAALTEAARLRRRGVAVVGPQNRLLQYLAVLMSVYTAIGLLAGLPGILFFCVQGVVGFSILEGVNYIQHYGLTRARRAANDFESIQRKHSWDSYHLVSNWCLFNLPQHSGHHAVGRASHEEADSRDSSPQLPLGYFALLWLAFLPPLYRHVMDRRLEQWQSEHRSLERVVS